LHTIVLSILKIVVEGLVIKMFTHTMHTSVKKIKVMSD